MSVYQFVILVSLNLLLASHVTDMNIFVSDDLWVVYCWRAVCVCVYIYIYILKPQPNFWFFEIEN
jgi:hypothetical protein